MHLRQLRGDGGGEPSNHPSSFSLKPPGSVRRTTSVAVQTSALPDYCQRGSFEGQGTAAILPIGEDDLSEPGLLVNGDDPAAMKSLGPTEEVYKYVYVIKPRP